MIQAWFECRILLRQKFCLFFFFASFLPLTGFIFSVQNRALDHQPVNVSFLYQAHWQLWKYNWVTTAHPSLFRHIEHIVLCLISPKYDLSGSLTCGINFENFSTLTAESYPEFYHLILTFYVYKLILFVLKRYGLWILNRFSAELRKHFRKRMMSISQYLCILFRLLSKPLSLFCPFLYIILLKNTFMFLAQWIFLVD